ncbi:TPA: transcriptional repressor NrdR [Candidatus Woesearchaeota archaeon]|nr:transcriptional repressor NrdR [Candidatus Woesearchaeota archaeon]
MQCPYCTSADTKVLESRCCDRSLRRRRECLQCANRFTTYERTELNLKVIKKDGREEPFSLEKIQQSIRKACSKSEEETISSILKAVEQQILIKKTSSIKTKDIGKIVLEELKKVDKMAYVRFTSVYKSIHDPKLLEKELQLIV